jgi:hypothetical protein
MFVAQEVGENLHASMRSTVGIREVTMKYAPLASQFCTCTGSSVRLRTVEVLHLPVELVVRT